MVNLNMVLNRVLGKLKTGEKGLYYVGGSDALPSPLSKEEEENL